MLGPKPLQNPAPLSPEAISVLAGLAANGSLLLTGPPACGKSYVMQEVADAFLRTGAQPRQAELNQKNFIAIPRNDGLIQKVVTDLSPSRVKRNVERIAFAPNTKPQQFTSGLRPKPDGGFQVIKGVLVRSNEHALAGGASLLIIDELNRGPAANLFGDALVAMEKERRLLVDDTQSIQSFPMHVMDEHGVDVEFYLSSHLYILAAMNQADKAVDALDTAFLRRWARYNLDPRPDLARELLGAIGAEASLPAADPSPAELMEALIRAWSYVNDQIALGESSDLTIGHGIMLLNRDRAATSDGAYAIAIDAWTRIAAHVREVFYGNVIGQSIALRATNGGGGGYSTQDVAYGQSHRQILREPKISSDTIYAVLRQVGG